LAYIQNLHTGSAVKECNVDTLKSVPCIPDNGGNGKPEGVSSYLICATDLMTGKFYVVAFRFKY
jgi:hypothetical protein